MLEKIRETVEDIDACTSWIFSDGFYGPNYYNFDEEEISGIEADKLREYCLSRISEAVDEIDDYVIYDFICEDEDGNELEEPLEVEVGRIDSREIAKELFHHVVEIYGYLP